MERHIFISTRNFFISLNGEVMIYGKKKNNYAKENIDHSTKLFVFIYKVQKKIDQIAKFNMRSLNSIMICI
jgi:hypothetical protein